jgi:hypothetical protein
MRLPTCSGLQRFMACGGSALVEQTEETERGASAKRGDLIHRVIAARLMGQPDPDMGRYKLPLGVWTMIGLAVMLGRSGDIHVEEAYSYDGDRVEVLGNDLGRAYNRPGNLNGAADIVVIREHALVADIKTGRHPAPDCAGNWQLASLAFFVSAAYPSVKTVTGAIAKMETSGEWTWSQHTWDRPALAQIRGRLDSALAALRVNAAIVEAGIGDPVVAPGAHCAYARCVCPHAFTPQASFRKAA